MTAVLLLAAIAAQDPLPPALPEPAVLSVPLAHAGGVLLGSRLALSIIWPEPYDPFPLSRSTAQFGRAYTEPPEFRGDRALVESDGDPWVINVVGHGLMGSEFWQRTRRCGGGPLAAALVTVGATLVWEYGVESFHKRPSGVDLVLTPLIGVLLGEARFQLLRQVESRPSGLLRTLGSFFLDPFGEAERRVLATRC